MFFPRLKRRAAVYQLKHSLLSEAGGIFDADTFTCVSEYKKKEKGD